MITRRFFLKLLGVAPALPALAKLPDPTPAPKTAPDEKMIILIAGTPYTVDPRYGTGDVVYMKAALPVFAGQAVHVTQDLLVYPKPTARDYCYHGRALNAARAGEILKVGIE